MESVWDYVMRRKPVFLGYFLLFIVSGFASCQLLNNLLPQSSTNSAPAITVEPETETPQVEFHNQILSPQTVAEFNTDTNTIVEPPVAKTEISFVHVDVANPAPGESSTFNNEIATINPSDFGPSEPTNYPTADNTPSNPAEVDIPLTGGRVSIFRTILAVLLAVTALTLAGFELYRAYEYFLPFFQARRQE